MAMLLRMLHLLPDLLELLLEHARRDLEVVRIRQLVQQGPLHSLARIALVFLAELPADRVLQRTEILHAHRRGERVVDRRLDGLAKIADGALEDGVLASQRLVAVVLRKGNLDLHRPDDLGPDELRLDAGDELVAAELEADPDYGSALECPAVDLPGEVDTDARSEED